MGGKMESGKWDRGERKRGKKIRRAMKKGFGWCDCLSSD
jgi:hypothetical protein